MLALLNVFRSNQSFSKEGRYDLESFQMFLKLGHPL